MNNLLKFGCISLAILCMGAAYAAAKSSDKFGGTITNNSDAPIVAAVAAAKAGFPDVDAGKTKYWSMRGGLLGQPVIYMLKTDMKRGCRFVFDTTYQGGMKVSAFPVGDVNPENCRVSKNNLYVRASS